MTNERDYFYELFDIFTKFVYNHYRALIYFRINFNKDIKGKCSSSQNFVMETSDHVNFLL